MIFPENILERSNLKIIQHKMSLFDPVLIPKGSILVHATNCKGIWGSGVAREFAILFPEAYNVYAAACRSSNVVGTSLVIRDQDYYVGCLNTSFDYGPRKDPPEKILEQTKTALVCFMRNLPHGIPIYSCKFNSGLFQVEWERTEALIAEIEDSRVWNVCSQ